MHPTFLHEGSRGRPEGGGGEREPTKILFKNRPMSRNQNPGQLLCYKMMKALSVKEELDQSDLWLANYAQNSHQALLLKMSGGYVRSRTGYVRSHRIYLIKVPDMSGPPRNFLLNFDSLATRHQIG
jgi:hypothetical protein